MISRNFAFVEDNVNLRIIQEIMNSGFLVEFAFIPLSIER
jgi:hypothetical protein